MSLEDDFRTLGLHGASQSLEEVIAIAVREALSPRQILEHVAKREGDHRRTRSFGRRLRRSHLGRFAPVADFDWAHPRRIDRALVEEAFNLRFVDEGGAVLFFGGAGTGKTHLAKALVHHAVAAGKSARFVHTRALCDELANQDTTSSLERRLRYYARPALLCIDEVAYQHIDIRRLDLLYELVRRRYDAGRAIVATACLHVTDWPQLMPSTAATAALVDRLIHRALVIDIDADSYRKRQATERAAGRK